MLKLTFEGPTGLSSPKNKNANLIALVMEAKAAAEGLNINRVKDIRSRISGSNTYSQKAREYVDNLLMLIDGLRSHLVYYAELGETKKPLVTISTDDESLDIHCHAAFPSDEPKKIILLSALIIAHFSKVQTVAVYKDQTVENYTPIDEPTANSCH